MEWPNEHGGMPWGVAKRRGISKDQWVENERVAWENWLKTVEHKVICPHCGKPIGYREVLVGSLYVCPYCHKPVGSRSYTDAGGGY